MEIRVCIWDREPKMKKINVDEVKTIPVGTELKLIGKSLRSLGIYIFSRKPDLCPPNTFHQHTHTRYKADKHIVLEEVDGYGGYGSLSAGATYNFKIYDVDPLNVETEVIAEGKWSYDYSVFGGGTSLVTIRFVKPCLMIINDWEKTVLYIVK
jgi:hypothetical protein